MLLKKAHKTVLKMECYSVERKALRKVLMTVLTKAESLVVMRAEMMAVMT
jgi:hypothetical protein